MLRESGCNVPAKRGYDVPKLLSNKSLARLKTTHKQSQMCPYACHKGTEGSKIQFHSFLISILKGSGQPHVPAAVSLVERIASTQWAEGWLSSELVWTLMRRKYPPANFRLSSWGNSHFTNYPTVCSIEGTDTVPTTLPFVQLRVQLLYQLPYRLSNWGHSHCTN